MQFLPSTILTDQSEGLTLNDSQIIEDFIEENARPSLYPAYGPINPLIQSSYIYVRAGSGEVSGPKCGKPKFSTACVAKDLEHRHKTRRLISEHCCSLTCPTCSESTARRSSERIRLRLEGLHAQYLKDGLRLGVPKHIEFSPPPDDPLFSMESLLKNGGKTAFDQINSYLKQFVQGGVYAGVLILHLERKRHHDGSECSRDGCRHRHKWIWGPHFHFIGYGFFFKSDYFHDQTGWVYKRIPDKFGQRDIKATAFYVLTHSAVFISKKSNRSAKNYRYVGLFQDKLAKMVKTGNALEPCRCPDPDDNCKAIVHKFALPLGFNDKTGHFDLLDEPKWDLDQGEAYRSVPVFQWIIKGKTIKQEVLHENQKVS